MNMILYVVIQIRESLKKYWKYLNIYEGNAESRGNSNTCYGDALAGFLQSMQPCKLNYALTTTELFLAQAAV